MRVEIVSRLDAGQLSAVLVLGKRAEAVDRVAPLSEQVLLATREGSTTGSAHFLAYAGTHLAGYAHLERGPAAAATAEVVVNPADRRQGVGTALIRALEDALWPEPDGLGPLPETEPVGSGRDPEASRSRRQALQIWSHGHLDGARALAVRDGYSAVRELWVMRRSLRPADGPPPDDDTSPPDHRPEAPGPANRQTRAIFRPNAAPGPSDHDSSLPDDGSLPGVDLPDGFRSRQFIVGQDEDAWLRVNARAFADHAEQGGMTRHDLDLRIAEPWFDASGFILIEDTRGAVPTLAASHWTKILPAAGPAVNPTQGEVYVVGVDPAYQGLGLGRAVTVLGLAHLRERGVTEAMLYVEADNVAAVATYSRLGFTRFAVDVMYSRSIPAQVPR
ncbi:MAG TPA: mycothiol synthase [Dermatophilaceae bacterium]